MTGIISAWIAEMIIITARDVKKGASNNVAGFPLPADYLATFAIFGVLAALPDSASTFAGVAGWGFVIATFFNYVDPALSKSQGPGTQTGSQPVPNPPAGTAVGPVIGQPTPFLNYPSAANTPAATIN